MLKKKKKKIYSYKMSRGGFGSRGGGRGGRGGGRGGSFGGGGGYDQQPSEIVGKISLVHYFIISLFHYFINS